MTGSGRHRCALLCPGPRSARPLAPGVTQWGGSRGTCQAEVRSMRTVLRALAVWSAGADQAR